MNSFFATNDSFTTVSDPITDSAALLSESENNSTLAQSSNLHSVDRAVDDIESIMSELVRDRIVLANGDTDAAFSDTLLLVSNGGFESGLANWSGFTGQERISTTESFSDSGSLELASADSGIGQFVDSQAGATYQLSGYAKTNSDIHSDFGINFFDASYNLLNRVESGDINSTSWQRFEMSGIAPVDTEFVQVWAYHGGNDGSTFIDELTLSTLGESFPEAEIETAAPAVQTEFETANRRGNPTVQTEFNEVNNGGDSVATISIQENNAQVTTLTAAGSNSTYTLVGGADASAFDIDAQSGALFFRTAPDYENPTDADGDNRYAVEVQVTSEAGQTESQSLTIDVTNEVSVYLLGGQSNAVGLAPNSELSPELDNPYPSVQIWQVDIQNFSDLRPGFAGPSGNWDQFGPELAFGRQIDGFASEEVYLIKHAQGSTNLAEDWNPSGENNDQYDTFTDRVSDALGHLDSQNIGYDIEGMLWMQGEFDAFVPDYANAYEANLTAFIADMRSRYGADMKFAIGRLHDTFAITLKTAQDNVAAADSLNVIVNTDNFEILPDGVHYSAAGQLDLGSGFADALK